MPARATLATLCMISVLSGCLEGTSSRPTAETQRNVAGVNITGPTGYCIDPAGSNAVFVLLGACDSLFGVDVRPLHYAILSAAVSETDTTAPIPMADYASFFASDLGLAALSRDGDSSTITVLASEITNDVLFLQIRDTSAINADSLAPEYWRALLRIDGRIVTLNVMSSSARELSANDGQSKLSDFVVFVQRANPA